MNSWRSSSHFLPVSVRNLMPSNHSASVSSTSRTKAWRWRISEVMISLKRGSVLVANLAITASVRFASVRLRIGITSGWFGAG